jgi:hypothetical protein
MAILRRVIAATCLALSLSVIATQATTLQSHSSPCAEQKGYRRLNFWLGDWDAVDAAGAVIGTAQIKRILNGCAVQFTWKDLDGSETLELFYYVPAMKGWRQVLVSDGGRTQERSMPDAAGTSEMLRFEGAFKTSAGRTAYSRSSVTRRSADEVDQRIERSLDRKGWETTFQATYKRRSPPASSDTKQ